MAGATAWLQTPSSPESPPFRVEEVKEFSEDDLSNFMEGGETGLIGMAISAAEAAGADLFQGASGVWRRFAARQALSEPARSRRDSGQTEDPCGPASETRRSGSDSEERLRAADGELSCALRSGDARRIEEACTVAEAMGLDPYTIAQARAKVRPLRAVVELLEAMRGKDMERFEEACIAAEAAGVDPGTVWRARAVVGRLRASRELSEAMRHGDAGRVREACLAAEAAGVSPCRIAEARGEARHLSLKQLMVELS